MPNYNVFHYSMDGELMHSLAACRIDIVNSHSIFYVLLSETKTYRVFTSVLSVNIERGIITVYYSDGSYIVITDRK